MTRVVALRPDGWPRRRDLSLLTPAEKAIHDAIQAVETTTGCDVLLTEAVTLLGQAQEKVADFVDRELAERDLRDLLGQVNEIICRTLPDVRSEELRAFIRKHKDVPGFKDLAFSLILLGEGG